MQITGEIESELNSAYLLSENDISFYDENRFIKLKNVFSESLINYFNHEITKQVELHNKAEKPLEDRNTYGKAFLQIFNLWREDSIVKELVFSKRIAKLATDLMQTKGTRIYHDQALFKEGGGGITPWHADQYYWPLESDKTITAWIPLQATPLELGPLEFSAKSHEIVEGRDLEISDTSELQIQKKLKVTDFSHIIEPFDVGEISFHSGWIFHRAGANTTNKMRKVMTIIYMDKEMILKNPENENQRKDWEKWCPGSEVGREINSELNPILFQY